MEQELVKISHDEKIYNMDVVYIIRSGEFVKIGRTGSLVTRLSSFKTHNPHPMHIVGLVKGGPLEEKILQDKFKHLHVRNEWFKYGREIQDYFSDFNLISLDELHNKVILQAAMVYPKQHSQTIRRLLKK